MVDTIAVLIKTSYKNPYITKSRRQIRGSAASAHARVPLRAYIYIGYVRNTQTGGQAENILLRRPIELIAGGA